jgi:hypothetical protein
MDDEENTDLIPKKQSLFPVSADDIVDNALQSLDEAQARRVTEKAADEVVRLAVEKRKAEYRNSAAQEEMRNLIHNANLLDQQVSDYKIDSTFETASGTTNVEIRKSSGISKQILIVAAIAALVLLFAFLFFGR